MVLIWQCKFGSKYQDENRDSTNILTSVYALKLNVYHGLTICLSNFETCQKSWFHLKTSLLIGKLSSMTNVLNRCSNRENASLIVRYSKSQHQQRYNILKNTSATPQSNS